MIVALPHNPLQKPHTTNLESVVNKPLLQLRQGFLNILVRIVAITPTPSRTLRQQQQKTPQQALVLHKLYGKKYFNFYFPKKPNNGVLVVA
jgi:hypothetical protein